MAKEWENYIANVLDAMNVYYAREVQFSSYRADFVLVGLDIVIEVDGPEHKQNAHHRTIDREKDNVYNERGFTVLRLTNNALETDIDAAIAYLITRIKERQKAYTVYNPKS